MKSYDTLLINKHWAATTIVDSKKAINLLYQGVGLGLDHDFIVYHTWEDWLEYSKLPEVIDGDYNFMRSVSLKVALPDIILLKNYTNLHVRDIKYSRESVFSRDKFLCQYCGKQFSRNDLTIDHIQPLSRGGHKSAWNNVVSCCKPCNHKKSDKTLDVCGMKLLHKPTEPKWKTPLGRAVNNPNIRSDWKRFLKLANTEDV